MRERGREGKKERGRERERERERHLILYKEGICKELLSG